MDSSQRADATDVRSRARSGHGPELRPANSREARVVVIVECLHETRSTRLRVGRVVSLQPGGSVGRPKPATASIADASASGIEEQQDVSTTRQ